MAEVNEADLAGVARELRQRLSLAYPGLVLVDDQEPSRLEEARVESLTVTLSPSDTKFTDLLPLLHLPTHTEDDHGMTNIEYQSALSAFRVVFMAIVHLVAQERGFSRLQSLESLLSSSELDAIMDFLVLEFWGIFTVPERESGLPQQLINARLFIFLVLQSSLRLLLKRMTTSGRFHRMKPAASGWVPLSSLKNEPDGLWVYDSWGGAIHWPFYGVNRPTSTDADLVCFRKTLRIKANGPDASTVYLVVWNEARKEQIQEAGKVHITREELYTKIVRDILEVPEPVLLRQEQDEYFDGPDLSCLRVVGGERLEDFGRRTEVSISHQDRIHRLTLQNWAQGRVFKDYDGANRPYDYGEEIRGVIPEEAHPAQARGEHPDPLLVAAQEGAAVVEDRDRLLPMNVEGEADQASDDDIDAQEEQEQEDGGEIGAEDDDPLREEDELGQAVMDLEFDVDSGDDEAEEDEDEDGGSDHEEDEDADEPHAAQPPDVDQQLAAFGTDEDRDLVESAQTYIAFVHALFEHDLKSVPQMELVIDLLSRFAMGGATRSDTEATLQKIRIDLMKSGDFERQWILSPRMPLKRLFQKFKERGPSALRKKQRRVRIIRTVAEAVDYEMKKAQEIRNEQSRFPRSIERLIKQLEDVLLSEVLAELSYLCTVCNQGVLQLFDNIQGHEGEVIQQRHYRCRVCYHKHGMSSSRKKPFVQISPIVGLTALWSNKTTLRHMMHTREEMRSRDNNDDLNFYNTSLHDSIKRSAIPVSATEPGVTVFNESAQHIWVTGMVSYDGISVFSKANQSVEPVILKLLDFGPSINQFVLPIAVLPSYTKRPELTMPQVPEPQGPRGPFQLSGRMNSHMFRELLTRHLSVLMRHGVPVEIGDRKVHIHLFIAGLCCDLPAMASTSSLTSSNSNRPCPHCWYARDYEQSLLLLDPENWDRLLLASYDELLPHLLHAQGNVSRPILSSPLLDVNPEEWPLRTIGMTHEVKKTLRENWRMPNREGLLKRYFSMESLDSDVWQIENWPLQAEDVPAQALGVEDGADIFRFLRDCGHTGVIGDLFHCYGENLIPLFRELLFMNSQSGSFLNIAQLQRDVILERAKYSFVGNWPYQEGSRVEISVKGLTKSYLKGEQYFTILPLMFLMVSDLTHNNANHDEVRLCLLSLIQCVQLGYLFAPSRQDARDYSASASDFTRRYERLIGLCRIGEDPRDITPEVLSQRHGEAKQKGLRTNVYAHLHIHWGDSFLTTGPLRLLSTVTTEHEAGDAKRANNTSRHVVYGMGLKHLVLREGCIFPILSSMLQQRSLGGIVSHDKKGVVKALKDIELSSILKSVISNDNNMVVRFEVPDDNQFNGGANLSMSQLQQRVTEEKIRRGVNLDAPVVAQERGGVQEDAPQDVPDCVFRRAAQELLGAAIVQNFDAPGGAAAARALLSVHKRSGKRLVDEDRFRVLIRPEGDKVLLTVCSYVVSNEWGEEIDVVHCKEQLQRPVIITSPTTGVTTRLCHWRRALPGAGVLLEADCAFAVDELENSALVFCFKTRGFSGTLSGIGVENQEIDFFVGKGLWFENPRL